MKLSTIIEKCISILNFWKKSYLDNKDLNDQFIPLSPTNSAENANDYLHAIEWALRNRNRIKNIAITGPYGSGKSSIIQTFQNNNKDNSNYKFLNISLATFKEDKEDKGTNETPKDNNDILRLIELSILQQIFYHETDSKIPDSRFLKIEKRNKAYFILSSLLLFLTIVSYLFLVHPLVFSNFSFFEVSNSEHRLLLKIIAVIFCSSTLIYITYKFLFLMKGLVIKKIGFSNAEIEIDGKISKSILNRHIDEILYFFEMSNYNIVVIEDLDRFEQTEVFTKLRELNLLLNNSKKIKSDIVFLYAIRDEMFENKDRAKFFDFIIPVIPVINSSNSSEKLLEVISKNKYVISQGLVEDVSLFIDDMRLLYNVMNEYYIYSKKIDSKLSQDNLLAIIIYKNMYPNDFSSLTKSEGVLFKTLKSKLKYISQAVSVLDEQILQEKSILKKIEENNVSDIVELRRIYISAIIGKILLKYPNQSFHAFYILNQKCSIEQLLEEDKFNYIKENLSNVEFLYTNNASYRMNVGFTFSEVESEIFKNDTYGNRAELIKLSNKKSIDMKRKKIESLEHEKNNIKKKKIKDLISSNAVEIGSPDDNLKQRELLNILLRQGYIDENYLDYLTIFYEGSLSRQDYDFLINVKTQTITDFDYRLDKIDNLIKRISIFDFEKSFILNYDLITHLLERNELLELKEKVFSLLADESESSIKFIDGFIEYSAKNNEFVKTLSTKWSNFWGFIQDESGYTHEKKKMYFDLIIKNASTDDVLKIFNAYSDSISSSEDFLFIINDELKIKSIISKLKIKFKRLSLEIDSSLIEYVYKNNAYEINLENLMFFISRSSGEIKSDFYTQNYTYLKNSGLNELVSYFEGSFADYLKNIYLKLDLNREDSNEYLCTILNNEEINIDLKELVLHQVSTKIINVENINGENELKIALKLNMIFPSWENVVDVYLREELISSELIMFLSNYENMLQLSKKKISDYPEETKAKEFIRNLILLDDLSIDQYSLALKSIPYVYNKLNFENLNSEKVEVLIKNKKISLNKDNISLIKSSFSEHLLLLFYINEDKLLEDISILDLDISDILLVLNSARFNLILKEELIKLKGEAFIFSNQKLTDTVAVILSREAKVNIPLSILKGVIIKNRLPFNERIRIFNKFQQGFEIDEIESFLLTLPEPFSIITEKGKMPSIEYSDENFKLAGILKDKKYISSFRRTMLGKIQIATFKN